MLSRLFRFDFEFDPNLGLKCCLWRLKRTAKPTIFQQTATAGKIYVLASVKMAIQAVKSEDSAYYF